jgi:hypothetical protein
MVLYTSHHRERRVQAPSRRTPKESLRMVCGSASTAAGTQAVTDLFRAEANGSLRRSASRAGTICRLDNVADYV